VSLTLAKTCCKLPVRVLGLHIPLQTPDTTVERDRCHLHDPDPLKKPRPLSYKLAWARPSTPCCHSSPITHRSHPPCTRSPGAPVYASVRPHSHGVKIFFPSGESSTLPCDKSVHVPPKLSGRGGGGRSNYPGRCK
jgi:hypothetical protein